MNVVEVIFWLSVLGIVYAYAGYPAVLWILARFRENRHGNPTDIGTALPSITMIISAYNESGVIGQKLRDTLEHDYPAGLLEVVVVSDGSTDDTVRIVQEFSGSGVVLRHYEGRIGKTACLNQALPLAQGSIIVFSDANSHYAPGSLRALAAAFEDRSVGFATGWTRYSAGGAGGGESSIGLYARLELETKSLESRLGSCIGADGAIFAIRKVLYKPLHAYDINDFVIPLTINKQGYRGVLQRAAVCLESDAGSSGGEFRRQVRITNRTIRALVNHRELLNPVRFGIFSFQLASHKLAKFLVPFLMAVTLLANVALAAGSAFYFAMLAGQAVFYAAASLGGQRTRLPIVSRAADLASTFVMANAAMAVAWFEYARGKTYTTWAPTQRRP